MNITLIGMPGSGKSHVGKMVAESLGYTFIDPDKLVEAEYAKPLQAILSELGDQAFLTKECDATRLATRGRNNSVIATGGSVVYSEDTMEYLADISFILYLEASLSVLDERIGTEPRGIVGSKEKSLKELYEERDPLYRRWANVTIDADRPVDEVMEQVLDAIAPSAHAR